MKRDTAVVVSLAALAVCVIVLGGLIAYNRVVISGIVTHAAVERQALAANVHNQVSNRANNVTLWCGAINHDRQVLVAYVLAASRRSANVPQLDLPQLPCAAIVAATAKSAAHK